MKSGETFKVRSSAKSRSGLHVGGHYLVLFLALCALGLIYPILGYGLQGLIAWNLVFWGVFVGGVRALVAQPRYLRVVSGLAIAAVVASITALICFRTSDHGHGWINMIMSLLNLCVISLTTGLLLLDVMKGGDVTVDRILGAGCVYVLIGLLFAFAFMTVHALADRPLIVFTEGVGVQEAPIFAEYLYFSFATLTTLGLGDVVPTTMFARLLVGAEAIVGQLYLTILVARLVGLHIAHASGKVSDHLEMDER